MTLGVCAGAAGAAGAAASSTLLPSQQTTCVFVQPRCRGGGAVIQPPARHSHCRGGCPWLQIETDRHFVPDSD
jgi:hypothetical protein